MTTAEPTFEAWLSAVQARMEAALARLLPAPQLAPTRLHEAMRYASLGGGKRVRPLLAFAAGARIFPARALLRDWPHHAGQRLSSGFGGNPLFSSTQSYDSASH